ncbi:hypothetical protein [Mailhella massiliensis]|uniref:Uncharacterized protein n=1 Tax=Mailhella massiliensis TaxID=1903261 RepID=A0A921AWD1_9BACT|nr:hypothetical protein [Mailhella massiliensis]HJD97343.1 hypothetical protein [Mailhella massiliensis]
MTGITFYLQICFALLLFQATATAIFMGVFHAHREGCSAGRRHLCLAASALLSFAICFFLYSWSYLSW